ncbi:SCO1664 family protein [Brevibacterium album]|uniref:SCO1664 family protein n=1 Tax=Brevibacterium album TaxID=417948 RepID=UPI000412993C|nr:SCO1664 family protein [Brevibacterium album]
MDPPEATALGLLRAGAVRVLGRMPGASNETLLTVVEGSSAGRRLALRAVLKTRSGERALPDFPPGTLSHREVAAYELSRRLGLDVVPPTVWRPDLDGSLQAYVETDPESDPAVVLSPPGGLPRTLAPVLRAQLENGAEVVLAHSLSPAVRRLALFDVLIDNADRKGGHILTGAWLCGPELPAASRVWGIDNGLSFNTAPTLRTVLWGFAGSALTEEERAAVSAAAALAGGESEAGGAELAGHLSAPELASLRARAEALLRAGHLPLPPADRRAVPWPPL